MPLSQRKRVVYRFKSEYVYTKEITKVAKWQVIGIAETFHKVGLDEVTQNSSISASELKERYPKPMEKWKTSTNLSEYLYLYICKYICKCIYVFILFFSLPVSYLQPISFPCICSPYVVKEFSFDLEKQKTNLFRSETAPAVPWHLSTGTQFTVKRVIRAERYSC